MNTIDTSGKALVEHWRRASAQGLMKRNTANALRAACTQVLECMEGWEAIDIRGLDIEGAFQRFQNKRHADFKPESLEAYRRRFSQGVRLFLEYSENPSGWKGPSRDRAPRGERQSRRPVIDTTPEPTTGSAMGAITSPQAVMDYTYPLREGRVARLQLPADLSTADVRRISAFLGTLAVDFDPENQ